MEPIIVLEDGRIQSSMPVEDVIVALRVMANNLEDGLSFVTELP